MEGGEIFKGLENNKFDINLFTNQGPVIYFLWQITPAFATMPEDASDNTILSTASDEPKKENENNVYSNLSSYSWKLIFATENIKEILGYSANELINTNISWRKILIHHADFPRAEHEVNSYLNNGINEWSYEYRVVSRNGKTIFFRDWCKVIKDEVGNIIYLESTLLDISSSKNIEHLLGVKEKAIELSLDAMVGIDRNQRIYYVNKAFLNLWGYQDKVEVLGKHIQRFWKTPNTLTSDSNINRDNHNNRDNRDNNKKFWEEEECRAIRKDGSELSVTFRSLVVTDINGKETGVMGVFKDISLQKTQKLLEEENLTQRQFINTLIETMITPVYSKDLKGRYNYCNEAFSKLLGIPKEELIGKNVQEISPVVEYSDIFKDKDLELIEKGGKQIYEAPLTYKDGEVHTVIFNKSTYYDLNNHPQGIMGVILDITERKKIEDELKSAIEEVNDLYNLAPCGYHSLDKDGYILKINDTELKWIGYTREEVVNKKKFEEFLTPESKEWFHNNFTSFKEKGVISSLEFTLIRRDHTQMNVLASATAVKDQQGNFIKSRTSLFDITEKKKIEIEKQELQLKLFHMERLATIGTFATSIAHEVNTPLSIARGIAELLRDELNLDTNSSSSFSSKYLNNGLEKASNHSSSGKHYDKLIAPLDSILDSLDKISEIVDGLRRFARTDDNTLETVNIKLVIENTVKLVENIYKKEKIKINQRLNCLQFYIKGNFNKLQQVMFNLLNNARDALLSKSLTNITASTSTSTSTSTHNTGDLPSEEELREEGLREERLIHIEAYNENNMVCIQVSDNGPGIPDQVLPHIFEPFFTTKSPGKGTGLGLPIINSIINSWGGKIKIDSELNIGTTITIILPNQVEASADAKANADVGASSNKDNLDRVDVYHSSKTSASIKTNTNTIEFTSHRANVNETINKKILIIDDEAEVRKFIKKFLERADPVKDLGFREVANLEILEAENGEKGLDLISKHKFEIVITDMVMPQLDGPSMVEAARKISPQSKYLIITGGIEIDYSTEQRQKLRTLADAYLKKPFGRNKIYETIKKTLANN